MSEAYKKFAEKTLDMITLAASMVRQDNNGKPLLIISAQSPPDTPFFENTKLQLKNLFNDKEAAAQEEPSMASAYAHVAAIRGAAKLLGDKKNVLVTFDLSPDEVNRIKQDAKNGKLDSALDKAFGKDSAAAYAFRYAYERGFTIAGVDAGKERAVEQAKKNNDPYKGARDETRHEIERHAINTMGTIKKAVVHITSIDHLPVLMGRKFGENPDYTHTNDPLNPYLDVYGLPLVVNSDDRNSPVFKSLTVPEFGFVQIDAPGRMDESDKTDIGKRIDEAANPPSPSSPSPPPSSPAPKKFSA